MLTAILIIVVAYPVVYCVRRFVLKEPKFTGDVDGDQNTRPKVALALAVAFVFWLAAVLALLALGVREVGVVSTTAGGAGLITYYFMRR